MNNLIETITATSEDQRSGNKQTMLGLLAYCIEKHENECDLIPNSAGLMKYVTACVRNKVQASGVDVVGYKQIIKFVKLWYRSEGLK